MNTSSPAILWSLAALGFLWFLYAWLYRAYRVDLFRQRLFVIRGELFDMASDGELAFDHPAYGMMRTTLNGAIRFAHRITFLDFVLYTAFTTKERAHLQKLAGTFDDRWVGAISDLPPETQKRLRNLRGRLHHEAVEQMVSTSVFFWILVVPIVVYMLCKVFVDNTAVLYRRIVGDGLPNKFRDNFDCAVYLGGSTT